VNSNILIASFLKFGNFRLFKFLIFFKKFWNFQNYQFLKNEFNIDLKSNLTGPKVMKNLNYSVLDDRKLKTIGFDHKIWFFNFFFVLRKKVKWIFSIKFPGRTTKYRMWKVLFFLSYNRRRFKKAENIDN
jgi:hypothetical protein